ncbi:aminodeoxychorismate synthase component I [Zhongshania sp.]|uniref:aminodeoxychorismate synthase component I n=1 Tax=Zhongshania sp. TaxID=1971902 RepID=UPI00356A940E
MASLCRIPLPYRRDSSSYFAAVKHLPLPVYLDSAADHSDRGRWDIICAEPEEVISSKTIDYSDKDTLSIRIASTLKRIDRDYIDSPTLPFSGGAIGYLSYEFGEELQLGLSPNAQIPTFHIAIYPWFVLVDHHQQRCELIAQPSLSQVRLTELSALLTPIDAPPSARKFRLTSPFVSSLKKDDYTKAFNKVKAYIDAGDCYQVNLTREFTASYQGDPWQAYLQLRAAAAAPFSAYMDFGDSQFLSLSPERLLAAQERQLQTQPIKGTAARSDDPQEDSALATKLQNSAKNRAENIMIVDLLRNDFSKSCQAETVVTEALCELQSFRTVHHLVSTVTGTLRDERSEFSALLDCFPGGSITGAPKHRAMEIISEIEPHRRSLYCGSIFYLGPNGKMDSNIAIRSFVCKQQKITGWAGGGIVADSVLNEEFIETETKISKLLEALADLGLKPITDSDYAKKP